MQDLLLTSAALLEHSFFLSLSYVHHFKGMNTRETREFMKPWGKQKLQVTPVIDEDLRQRGLPVSHSKPDRHSHFFCVFANSALIPPRLSFLRANKKKGKMCHTKLPAKHSSEGIGGQFLMRTRRRGKTETARTSENIHPLKHLTHIPEKSWARRWVKPAHDSSDCSFIAHEHLPQWLCHIIIHILFMRINIKWLREAQRAPRGSQGLQETKGKISSGLRCCY